MPHARVLAGALALTVLACNAASPASEPELEPAALEGTYALVADNGQSLPADPSAPFGCCLTLGGSLSFTATAYEIRTSHRNKNNGIVFDNAESGTYALEGGMVHFTRTGGAGEAFPYLLAPGRLSADGNSLTVPYGDEGPGSDQSEFRFQR